MVGATRRAVLAGLASVALAPRGARGGAPHLVMVSTPHAPVGPAFRALVGEAFARIGAPAEFDAPGPERGLREVTAGRASADGPRVRAVIGNYPGLHVIDEALVDYRFVAFSRRLEGPVGGWDFGAGKAAAVVRGWKILESRVVGESVLAVRDTTLLFEMLVRDRVDFVVHEEMTGRATAEEVGVPGLRVLDPPFAVLPMFLCVHDSRRELVRPLTEALRAMKADGSGQAVLQALFAPRPVSDFPGFAAHWWRA